MKPTNGRQAGAPPTSDTTNGTSTPPFSPTRPFADRALTAHISGGVSFEKTSPRWSPRCPERSETSGRIRTARMGKGFPLTQLGPPGHPTPTATRACPTFPPAHFSTVRVVKIGNCRPGCAPCARGSGACFRHSTGRDDAQVQGTEPFRAQELEGCRTEALGGPPTRGACFPV